MKEIKGGKKLPKKLKKKVIKLVGRFKYFVLIKNSNATLKNKIIAHYTENVVKYIDEGPCIFVTIN